MDRTGAQFTGMRLNRRLTPLAVAPRLAAQPKEADHILYEQHSVFDICVQLQLPYYRICYCNLL
jgi:hypothetical protein